MGEEYTLFGLVQRNQEKEFVFYEQFKTWPIGHIGHASCDSGDSVGGCTMRFGCTVVFVKDVPVTVAFYEKAFGLKRRLMREDLGYAELGTGSTALAFKNHSSEPPPAGFEITLYTPDVDSVFDRAVTAGAEALLKPEMKSWGQKVARVRDCNGVQVEIATPLQ